MALAPSEDREEPDQYQENRWPATASSQLHPLVVAPLREFSRRVIDPIVEFAKRPTTLQTLPDFSFPRFESSEPEPEVAQSAWAVPERLRLDLDRLSTEPETATWAARVLGLIDELCSTKPGRRFSRAIVADLAAATQWDVLPELAAGTLQTDLVRTRYALQRRVEIWDRISHHLPEGHSLPTASLSNLPDRADQSLTHAVDEVERLTASIKSGDAWREYLLLTELRSLNHDSQQPREAKRALAESIMTRLETARRAQAQRGFVSNQPFDELRQQLLVWGADPIIWPQLLKQIEDYERKPTVSGAQAMAMASRVLRLTGDEADRELGERLDLHYRNANLRLAVTTDFMNRLVTQPHTLVGSVRDSVQGIPVRGRSTTFTKVSLHTIPDANCVRLGLEADGMIAANTTSDAGMARFFNRSESNFRVRKLMVFGPHGLRSYPAVSDAESYYTNLTDVETNFDGIPLVGAMVRGMAISQHDEAAPQARREMESKMARRVRTQFDQELEARLATTMKKADREVLEPLRQLGLEPTALDLNTTDTRATLRIRLADEHQLAAHTPRPRAPGNSLVSLQLHESALNNVLESLDLAGREFTIAELYAWLGKKLHRADFKQPDDVPADVVVKFADDEPIRVQLVDGQLQLAIRLAKLTHNRKRWRDFTVRARYQPDESTRAARFVRSGAIWLEGESLQGRAEFVLRSILSKALSIERPWQLVPQQLADDPRLADLDIAQFVVEDGWVGLAYARGTAPKPVVVDRPTTVR
jgi:hypothetical protein